MITWRSSIPLLKALRKRRHSSLPARDKAHQDFQAQVAARYQRLHLDRRSAIQVAARSQSRSGCLPLVVPRCESLASMVDGMVYTRGSSAHD